MVWLPCVGSVLGKAFSAFCQEHMLLIFSGSGRQHHSSSHQLIHIGVVEVTQPAVQTESDGALFDVET